MKSTESAPSSSARSRRGLAVVLAVGAAMVVGAVVLLRPPAGPTAANPAATGPAPAGYDPNQLLSRGAQPGEVFSKEPRSGDWATSVEAVIGGAMSRDLAAMIPEATLVVTCKTLSCLVAFDAPPNKRDAARAISKFVMLAPRLVDLPPEDDGTERWMFFQEPRFADASAFLGWYAQTRQRTLESIRAGQAPNPFPVELSKIPHE